MILFRLLIFRLAPDKLCANSAVTINNFEYYRYVIPSIWKKMAIYNSFDYNPVSFCFLQTMYLTITAICVGWWGICVIFIIGKIDLLSNDRLLYIIIFMFLALGLCFGSVDKRRIGLMDIYYGPDGLFIPKEVFFYSFVLMIVIPVIVCNSLILMRKNGLTKPR